MLQIVAKVILRSRKDFGISRESGFFSAENMSKITKFYFQKAKYLVGGDNFEAFLVVDYKNNQFEYNGAEKSIVSRFARDLLKRKHNVNFADKIRS